MKRKSYYIILGIITISIVALFVYTALETPLHIKADTHSSVSLSKDQQHWVDEKKSLKISTDKELSYGSSVKDELQAKTENAFANSGLDIEFTEGKGDVKAVSVSNANRESLTQKGVITKPVYQISGKLFINTELSNSELKDKKKYTCIAIKGDMSERELGELRYDGKKIDVTFVKNPREAIALARENEPDFVIGIAPLIEEQLNNFDLYKHYRETTDSLFVHNICFLVPKGKATMYDVVDAYLEKAYEVGDSFSDSVILIIIIFVAVLGAFLVYFISTKNLYDELAGRMQQLKESKSELETTFNGVPLYMAEISPEGDVININRAMLELIHAPAASVIGESIGDVMSFEVSNLWRINGVIKQIHENGIGQSIIITNNRKIFDIEIYPIDSGKGKENMLLFMATDVTEIKMAERQMLQQNKMIAVGQLAAGVAHEIRNPLGLIRNYCYILKTTDDEKLRNEAIKVIENSVDRSGNIIQNLLNFSKQSDLVAEEILIKKHISEVISINEGMLKKKNIKLNFNPEDDFEVKMYVESFDMILINLLSNSVDAIEGNGTISIDITKERNNFRIKFTDTGCGMNEETKKNAFNPFFTTKIGVDGNGLGLYIVYNEIGKLDGEIRLESVPGMGTTFRITLPIVGGNQ